MCITTTERTDELGGESLILPGPIYTSNNIFYTQDPRTNPDLYNILPPIYIFFPATTTLDLEPETRHTRFISRNRIQTLRLTLLAEEHAFVAGRLLFLTHAAGPGARSGRLLDNVLCWGGGLAKLLERAGVAYPGPEKFELIERRVRLINNCV